MSILYKFVYCIQFSTISVLTKITFINIIILKNKVSIFSLNMSIIIKNKQEEITWKKIGI